MHIMYQCVLYSAKYLNYVSHNTYSDKDFNFTLFKRKYGEEIDYPEIKNTVKSTNTVNREILETYT